MGASLHIGFRFKDGHVTEAFWQKIKWEVMMPKGERGLVIQGFVRVGRLNLIVYAV